MERMTEKSLQILFLGASYGVVLGMRIAAAGHRVTFVCREEEAALINDGKIFLHLPAKNRTLPLEIAPHHCSAPPDASDPSGVDPGFYDLAILAMGEPQYSVPDVRALIERIARASIPCLSIMNMPLPPFLRKLADFSVSELQSVFTDTGIWSSVKASHFTMASADPQAVKLDVQNALVVKVTLPTNFKVGPFELAKHQRVVERLARDIDETRIAVGDEMVHPCVRLRPSTDRFIALAKWPMLITGNFRCLTEGAPVPIRDAVCHDEIESQDLYAWVQALCLRLGVKQSSVVPFEAYKKAAESLSLPSSLARALHAGATAVERIDLLVRALARREGMNHAVLDQIVLQVDGKLQNNRARLQTLA
jgi:ketopantoate reductase